MADNPNYLPQQQNTELEKLSNSDPLFKSPSVLKNVDQIVNKSYLQTLQNCDIIPCPKTDVDIAETVCFFPIRRIVLDKQENSLQKLASVYASAGSMGANLSMIIRGYESGETEIYLGVCCEDNRINGAFPKTKGLFDSFIGNFPGCRDEAVGILNREETRILRNKCFDLDYTSAASVSCIASSRENHSQQNGGFYQGLDKVIETMSGKKYTIVVLARPVEANEIEAVKNELEHLYTSLSVYAKIQMSSNWSAAQSISKSYTETMTDSISKTKSASLNIGRSNSHSHGTSEYGGTSVGLGYGGVSVGANEGSSVSANYSNSTTFGQAVSDAVSKTGSKSLGATKGKSESLTLGETMQLTVENKTISEVLKRIDEQLQRIRRGKGLGMFAAAAYFLTPSLSQSRIAASSFKAVVSGTDTELESSAMNVWTGAQYRQILPYLKQFQHPVFSIEQGMEYDEMAGAEKPLLTATPAVLTTSDELSILMGLPRNKVNGIPVRDAVAFERNIIRMNKNHGRDEFKLGKAYYLDHEEKNDVLLNLDSLTMHCFITGTTGSGKSNTVYGLLNNALAARSSLHFMVIEPVKGDYKTVFGHRKDVEVYGTNESVSSLLRINPFRFRNDIHVLEHIDYLISIFNVCWPMEAAMPSVLKQAVERAYEHSGWNLRKSTNAFSDKIYPTFEDVLNCVNQIMDESDYSSENKGNYKGALCTRLKELTTGTNSMIFTSNDLSDEELFDRNVIIDLSRLGSVETKALIMGLLVIRLKEYRQSATYSLNSGLKHITVLEEAHNLLKRTSTEQAMNTANMTGKAVEMLSNSLAELRSTGEGFIIVDQAPGLLDLSAIRNTNTKIVLRLPEASDRELTGHSMSLNPNQIEELAKLPTGVAAVYQNDWLGAILTKIPYCAVEESIYRCPDRSSDNDLTAVESLGVAIAQRKVEQWLDQFCKNQMEAFFRLSISGETKRYLCEYMSRDIQGRQRILPLIAYSCFNTKDAVEKARNASSAAAIRSIMARALVPSIINLNEAEQDFIVFMLVTEHYLKDGRFEDIAVIYEKYMREKKR